jgi:exopolyphosphatase/guanosine-5'-triphosphate,3'-diphosphate pyrophosphatase
LPHEVPDVLAAVDLGSNSFHMVVARHVHGQLTVVDRLRETVRLAAGLDEQGQLSRESMQRALATLERFRQRLGVLPPSCVRVVGTDTLRRARGNAAFLERASAALGHPIEIISGLEEARLIHLGVAHTTPQLGGRRLVVDVGGGSTELIVGEGYTAHRLESLSLGCVTLSERFFAGGAITVERMQQARTAARCEIEPVEAGFTRSEWNVAWGSSGALRAIAEGLQVRTPTPTQFDRAGLEWLLEECLRAGHASLVALPGLTPDRRLVLPGALAITLEVFARLGIDVMRIADGALREGVLCDLIARQSGGDARA